MHLEDTTLAPKGSWRETKIEYALVLDIARTIALYRRGDDSGDREYHPEAERLLRLFIARGALPDRRLGGRRAAPGLF